jgi:arginase
MKRSTPTLLGIPFDANSSYLRGAADAPPLIREAFRCNSSNSSTESGIDLDSESVSDAGDLELPADGAFTAIESAVAELLDKGQEAVKKLSFRAHNAIADLASVGRLWK